MNAILDFSFLRQGSHSPKEIESALNDAHRRGLLRLFQALLREGFLSQQDFINDGNSTWLPLWKQKKMLKIDGLVVGRAGHCQLRGQIGVYQNGQSLTVVDTANQLLLHVFGEEAVSAENLSRLQSELTSSAENDALCHQYRQQWRAELKKSIANAGHASLVSALQDEANPLTDNPALLLEQWGSIGHPFHPAHKSKVGLSADEVLALSPEFRPELTLTLAALKASVAKVSSTVVDDDADSFCYTDWMTTSFPAEMAAWKAALHRLGENERDWLPLPIHPYQAQQVVPHRFAAEISAGLLCLSDEFPSLPVSPTLSFRTMASSENPIAPHIKLPVSLQLTSAERTVSPRATVMGPRVSRLVREILQKEAGLGQTLAILPEAVGVHYIDPEGDANRARHLSVLFRENPMRHRRPGYLPVPVAALFADSPVDGRPILLELVASASGDHAAGALDYFRDYARTVLQATLSAWLVYGVAFEAHQQNSFVLFDEKGRASQLLLRDFGDIRIYTPALHARGLQLDNYQAGHFLFDDDVTVREKFLHSTMICHLVEIAMLLARCYGQHDDAYWQVLCQTTLALFDQLRERCDETRWVKEHHAVFYADWPVKSLLRMRLDNTIEDICLSMPNPLTNFLPEHRPK